MNQNKDIWVFLSHSNEDYEKVRIVRNILEEHHFRPLMFFLKCLDDEEEIDSLIMREIDCRTRFILCDSDNAKKSKWVQKEVAYIKKQQRTFQTIDLNLNEEEMARELMKFKTDATFFISCPREHWDFANELSERLRKYDYFVFFDNCTIFTKGKFRNSIKKAIDDAAQNGIFISIVGKATFDPWRGSCRELKCAIRRKAKIIPVYVESGLPENHFLHSYDGIDVSSQDHSVDKAIGFILSKTLQPGSIMALANDFIDGKSRPKDPVEADICKKTYLEMIKEGQAEPTSSLG